jgi:hypothetical protein
LILAALCRGARKDLIMNQCVPVLIIATMSLLAGFSPAFAEGESPFLGKWTATWENKEGKTLQANVSITETGGAWQTLASRKYDFCVGKEAPIEIKSSTPREMKFSIKYSSIAPDCKDANVTLSLREEGTVVGRRGGEELTFTRK